MKKYPAFVTAMIFALPLSVFAADDSTQQQRPPQGKPPGPPPEALAACNGLAVNAVCSFKGRNNEAVTGVCATPPSNAQTTTLGCRPNHPPHGGPGDGNGPPPNGMPPSTSK